MPRAVRCGTVLFGLFVVSFVAVQGVILHGMRADPEAETGLPAGAGRAGV